MRVPSPSHVVLAIVLVAFAPSARAGEFEFAESLAAYGYFDLAEEEFKKISEDQGLSEEERADGDYGLCMIRSYQAERLADMKERLEAYTGAMDCLRQFYGKHPDASKASEARLQVGILQRTKGQWLQFNLENEADPKARDEMKKEAVAAYEDAIKEFEKIKSDENLGEDLKLQARYYSLESLWYAGYVGSVKSHLEKCVADSEEFVWDTEPQLIAYYAYILQGMALGKLGKIDEGIVRFQTVTSLDMSGVPPELMQEVTSIKAQAYFGMIRALVEGNRPKDTDAVYEAFTKSLPGGLQENFGRGATFWAGMAAESTGDMGKALVVYSRLAERSDLWGAKAKARLDQLLEGGGKVDPKTYFQMAQGHYSQGKWDSAIDSFHNVVEAANAGGDAATIGEFVPQAWDSLGDCYFRLSLFLEAGLSYEAAAREGLRHKGDAALKEDVRKRIVEIAESASYLAYVSFKRAHSLTQDPVDKERSERAREVFLRDFPSSPKRENINYEKALDLEQQYKYLEAAQAFDAVGRIADNYEQARFRIGYCHYREGLRKLRDEEELRKTNGDAGQQKALHDQALAEFEIAKQKLEEYKAYTEKEENALLAQKAKESRADAVASAVIIIAAIAIELDEYDTVISSLSDGRGTLAPVIEQNSGSIPMAYKYLAKAYIGRADVHLADARAKEGDERAAAVALAVEQVRLAQDYVERLTSGYQGVSGAYFYSFEIGKRLQDVFRLTDDRTFKRDSSLLLAQWVLQKEAEGKRPSFGQAFVAGRNLQAMAVEEKEADPRSAKWRKWLSDCAAIFNLCLREAKEQGEIRSARLRLARIYVDLEQHQEALSQFSALYQENKKNSETVNSMANLFREIGIKQSGDKSLYAEVFRISKEEEEGVLREYRAEPAKLVGDVANRLIECQSFVSYAKGSGWWSESKRQAMHEDFKKRAESDNAGYGKWLGDEYEKAIKAKYDMLQQYMDKEPGERQKVIRQLAMDLAVRLYVTIAKLTPTDYEPPAEIKDEPFLKGKALKLNMQFPTNSEWWEAKHHLLECYHYLEQKSMKIALAQNIKQLNLPTAQSMLALKQKLTELRDEAEAEADPAKKEKLSAVADYYSDYVDMLDTYAGKIDRLTAE